METTIVVAGSGKTTRANVEALIEDYLQFKGNNATIVLPVSNRPSEGQIWAAQYAASQQNTILVVAKTDSLLAETFPAAKRETVPNPINTAMKYASTAASSHVFILWDDEDPECLDILSQCKRHDVPAYDLTNGLMRIVPSPTLQEPVEVSMPVSEMMAYTPDSPEDEEDEEEDSAEDTLLAAVETIADIFAQAIADRLKEILDERD